MANSRIREYLRGDKGAPGEKKLVRKIDFFILSFCCLMYVPPLLYILPKGDRLLSSQVFHELS